MPLAVEQFICWPRLAQLWSGYALGEHGSSSLQACDGLGLSRRAACADSLFSSQGPFAAPGGPWAGDRESARPFLPSLLPW